LLAAAGATLATTAVPRAARAWPGDGGWPMAAHDLAGTRATPTGVRRGAGVRWRAHAAGGVPGAAAVAGRTVVAASLGGEVVALDRVSGAERWRVALPPAVYDGVAMGFFAGPAVADGRVVVASDRVTALDLRTGRARWAAPPLGADDYFWGPPTVVGRLVLIGSGSGSETPRSRGRLSAYDVWSGRLRWSTATVPEGANGGGVIAPATVDLLRGRVYVTTGAPYAAVDGTNPGTASLLELRLRDGAVTWADQVHPHDTRGLDLNSAAVLLGPLAFATVKDGVYAWDRVRRTRLWHTQLTPESAEPGGASSPVDGPEFGPLATDGRRLYALSNDSAREVAVVAALDPRDGRVLWRTDVPGFAFAAPALAGGVLWTATAAGVLHALRAADGAPLGQIDLGAPSAGAVSAASGLVFAGTGAAPHLPGDELICIG
jgi:outer membrane protein assembly factor BamB